MIKKQCLFYLVLLISSCYLNEQDYLQLLAEMKVSTDISVENMEWEINSIIFESKKILADDSKAKYRPIGVVIHQVDEKIINTIDTINSFIKLVRKSALSNNEIETKIDKLEKHLFRISDELLSDYVNLIEEYGLLFGIREKDMKPILEAYELKTKFYNEKWIKSNYDKIGKIILPTVLNIIIFDIKNAQWQMVEHLHWLIGGKPIYCYFGIFPMINPMQNCLKKGETFKATISVGPSDYEVHPNDIQIFVDDEKLEFIKGKYVLYKSPPIFKNKKIIHISCQIKNQITNKWESIFTNIPYEIRLNK